MCLAVIDCDHVAVQRLLEHERLAARADVLLHERVRRIHRDVAKSFGFGVVRHLQHMRVVGIENRGILCDLDRHALDLGQLFERIDALHAQVISRYVQACRHIAAPEPESAAQHSAARYLEHGCIHGRVAQDHLR